MSISDPASAAAALPSLPAPRDRLGGWLDGRGRTLVLLMVAAVLPLLVFGGIAGLLSAQRTRAATRSLAVQLVGRSAERISIEVDAQLDLSQALAESTALDRGDFAAFGTEVQRLTELHPLWQGIVLTAPDGRTLFSSTLPAAARLGAATDQSSFRQVLRTSRPSVGGVAPAGLGPTTATLRVPVLRQGVLRYVLSLAVAPDAVGAILDSAGLPPGWIGVVVDAGGHVLALTGDAHESLGQLAGLGLLDAIAPGRPGFTIATTRRGIKVETVARVLPRTGGWVVAFGIPIQTLQRPVDQALLVLAGVGGASACLAAMLASLVTRELHQRRARERERAAQALQASEARRALAVDAAELGTWRWDIAADRFEASPRCRSMLDLSPPPTAERWQDALAAMHPDDRAGFDRAVAAALDQGAPLSAEFRIRLPDGGARWLRASGRLLAGEGGLRSLQGVMDDVTQARLALADRQDLLRRLSLAQEEERRRISRELHDQVGQSVTGLSLGLKALERAAGAPLSQLRTLQSMVGEIGRDIHRAAADLRPSVLDDLGLDQALEALAANTSEFAGVRIDVQAAGARLHLPPEIEIVIYRAVQEALTNALKHAHPSTVSVVLERTGDRVRAIVEDNGAGFDPHRRLERSGEPHLGLSGMRERLALVGGALTIESTQGAGTTLFIDIPVTPLGSPA